MRKLLQRLGILKPRRPIKRTLGIGNKNAADPYLDDFKYPDNRVVSSRYTILTFLPKNLFEQFQRIANFYFLCVAIIQLFIDTPVSPVTSILPLVFVLLVTACKQGYEDYLRHKSDNEVNNQFIRIVRNGELRQIKSMEICVGDIVYCEANETFPSDLVLLSSSDPNGTCFVTTASLDGETNLKTFTALAETRKLMKPRELQRLNGRIECQQPTDDLYRFVGRMVINGQDGQVERPLSALNILLRGARLKNTDFVFGCAVYTGPDTKMAMNSKEKKAKVSRVENRLNYFLAVYLVLLVCESVLSTGLMYSYDSVRTEVKGAWYIPLKKVDAWRVVQDIFGFIVLYNYLIPISLYVTIELQKFIGSKFFQWDLQMYDVAEDRPAKANTSDLNEELGQIEYLFSDKTGTLTENDMQFRQCCVNGVYYAENDQGLCVKSNGSEGERLEPLGDHWPGELEDFFVVLSLCHTVRLERRNKTGDNPGFAPNPNQRGSGYEYQAASPDEKAFVEACQRFGFVFHGIDGDIMTISVRDQYLTFEVLQTLEFDSDRKCMSVVLRSDDGSIRVLCKGAESSMLSKGIDSRDSDYILEGVNAYAMRGLRTLVIGERPLSNSEYHQFEKMLERAKLAEDRDRQVIEAYNIIENDLKLIGCTGIEDKLQDGVKQTIEDLRLGGIQVWVLTGDKEETAVNISYSAGHFSTTMQEIRLTRKESPEECYRALKTQRARVKEVRAVEKARGGHAEFALVVDGQTMSIMLQPTIRDYFLALCLASTTVLCCRMTPLQKAEVVSLVKTGVRPEPVTAAVGDGANDVSMIQEAHVGFGIYGKEGRQAVRASDYAFGRFRFLRQAILMHGHLYYARISLLVQYFFYKNIAFITGEFWFAIFSAWSAQTIYDSIFLVLYNITLTSLPIFFYGLFEQHMDRDQLLSRPELYRRITRNERLSWANFAYWNFTGLWHSIVCFYGVYMLTMTGNEVLGSDGLTIDLYAFGTFSLIIVLVVVTTKLMLASYYVTLFTFLGVMITVMGNALLILVYSAVIIPPTFLSDFTATMYWVVYFVLGYPSTWLSLILLTAIAILPDLIFKGIMDQRAYDENPKKVPKGVYNMSISVSRNSVQAMQTIEPVRVTRISGVTNPAYDEKDSYMDANGSGFQSLK